MWIQSVTSLVLSSTSREPRDKVEDGFDFNFHVVWVVQCVDGHFYSECDGFCGVGGVEDGARTCRLN